MKNKKNIYTLVLSLIIFTIISSVFLSSFKDQEILKQVPINENVNNISAYINVLDKNYSVKVEEGATAFDVMKSAQNSGLSFNGKEYSGMGYFIDEINGIKGEKGKYWFYSINEKEAEIGLSKYVVKNGDIISWKLK